MREREKAENAMEKRQNKESILGVKGGGKGTPFECIAMCEILKTCC